MQISGILKVFENNLKSRNESQEYRKLNPGNLDEFLRKKYKNAVRILKRQKLAAKDEKVNINNRNTWMIRKFSQRAKKRPIWF